MKKIYIWAILLLLCVDCFSQNKINTPIYVDSFKLTDYIKQTKNDYNGKPYCFIIVSTPNMNNEMRNKLKFGTDNKAGIFMEESATTDNRIKLSITYLVSALYIAYDDYSPFEYPLPKLEPYKTYEMVIMQGDNNAPKDWYYLVLNIKPEDATVSIDGSTVVCDKPGYLQKGLISAKQHKIKISRKLYHDFDTTIAKNNINKVIINAKLKPNYGSLNVKTNVTDAQVFLNGNYVGRTPYTGDKIASGKYKLEIQKKFYKTIVKDITIYDEANVTLDTVFLANYAIIEFVTDPEADIYLDGEKIGKGRWKDKVEEGVHNVVTCRQSHRDSEIQYVTVKTLENRTVTLKNPTPIYGSLDVTTSKPQHAKVYIDSKYVGTTPYVNNNVLIGSHTLRIEQDGYNPMTKSIEIKEGITRTMKDIVLDNEKKLKITTDKTGDEIVIEEQKTGTQYEVVKTGRSPFNTAVTYGEYRIKASRYDGKTADASVTIKSYSPEVTEIKLKLHKGSLAEHAAAGYIFGTLNTSVNTYSDYTFGLTIGSVKKYGWFLSAMTGTDFHGYNTDYTCDENYFIDGHYPIYTGNNAMTAFSVIAGGLMQINNGFCLRAGLGYGSRIESFETYSGSWVKSSSTSFKGLDISLGIHWDIRGLLISTDLVFGSWDKKKSFFDDIEFKIGVGYAHKHKTKTKK